MSNYPEEIDIFTDKTGADDIASSDPNVAYAGIETTQGLIGGLGKPQSWSTTLVTLLRRYKSGMTTVISGGVPVVRSGEAVLENTNGTKLVFRKNSSDVTLGSANIDAGTLVATTYYVYLKGGTPATTSPIVFSTDIIAPSAIGTAPYRQIGWFENTAIGSLSVTNGGPTGDFSGGRIINEVYFEASAVSSGIGDIPLDDSKPQQSSEGVEFMSVDYAPSSENNILRITVSLLLSTQDNSDLVVALFQDGAEDAIRAGAMHIAIGNAVSQFNATWHVSAVSRSKRTYKIKAGDPGGGVDVITLNGSNAARLFGGAAGSSITITEIEA